MRKQSSTRGSSSLLVVEVLQVLVIIIVLTSIFHPVIGPAREYARKSSCQSNLKELALAMQMYWNDYDGTLPSSILHQRKKSAKWNARTSAEFCAELGKTPVASLHLAPNDVHWTQLLWPHMKNKDIIWCPVDPDRPHTKTFLTIPVGNVVPTSRTFVTYIYKPAIDRAWFSGFKKEEQFNFVADQVMFFEHTGWHWGDHNKGWSNKVSVNAAFMDGHVRNIRFKHAVGSPVPKTSAEFTKILSKGGEPMWFNYDSTKGSGYVGERAVLTNPERYWDNLP